MSTVADKYLHVPATYGQPPGGWTWSRLDDVSEGVFDCLHSTPKLTDAGPFVVRTQNIITGVFRAEQAGRVSEETYAERIARVTPSRGDLLYSREGTYFGVAAEVSAKTRVCLGQRMVLIRPDKRRLEFGFLRHWLNSPIMAAHIHGYRDGSVAERLNLPTIRALPILIPPLAEQKAIAAVLGALDGKIDLNRRMNATLEAMTRAVFQSRFVDFDPVRAKHDGHPPPPSSPTRSKILLSAIFRRGGRRNAYLLARSDALRTHAIQNMTVTSGRQRVPSECFNTFWLAVLAKRFDELTAPLMAKIKANSTESKTLVTLRDTLLPKRGLERGLTAKLN